MHFCSSHPLHACLAAQCTFAHVIFSPPSRYTLRRWPAVRVCAFPNYIYIWCVRSFVQLLVEGGQTTTAISAQSPLSAGSGCLNAPSLSPTGSASGVQMGALSPGAMSQVSNAAATTGGGSAAAASSAAAATAATAAAAAAGSTPSSCCENGRPIMTDPVSGQTVCSCQYDSARLALSGYSRIPSGGVSVYGTPYPSTDQNPYPSIGVDSSAFYSPLVSAYLIDFFV